MQHRHLAEQPVPQSHPCTQIPPDKGPTKKQTTYFCSFGRGMGVILTAMKNPSEILSQLGASQEATSDIFKALQSASKGNYFCQSQ